MPKLFAALAAGLVSLALAIPAGAKPLPNLGSDQRVTSHTYVRFDGGTDAAIQNCNDPSATGGTRFIEDEPFSIVDPIHPNIIAAGWNDFCGNWLGLGFSTDGGTTWKDSLVPGYPADTSTLGSASPLRGRGDDASDPVAAFDRQGNLFYGGISFKDSGIKTDGDVFVSSYGANPPAGNPSYPFDYKRTVLVGRGTPSRNFLGIFNDKPMLQVDTTGGPFDANVYICWSRFVSNGQSRIFFSRSADGGQTFTAPLGISGNHSVQGCDIAVQTNGDVFVTWRTIDDNAAITSSGISFARSTNGGLSFSNSRRVQDVLRYTPFDGTRDCGDGPDACPAGFTFARIPLEPRVSADPTGKLPGVFVIYNAVNPATVVPSTTSYSSAGLGQVGQSLVFITRSTNNGASWSTPVAVAPSAVGHQFFADGDALDGHLAIVWQDSRADPAYSVQLPIGNKADRTSSGTDIVRTFFTSSTDGTHFGPAQQASAAGMQPQYEMFDAARVPFIGDYNWISLVKRPDGSLFGSMAWTDNRNVVAGTDPRDATADGFDVLQCRADFGGGVFGSDTCFNLGGRDQNIYGNTVVIP